MIDRKMKQKSSGLVDLSQESVTGWDNLFEQLEIKKKNMKPAEMRNHTDVLAFKKSRTLSRTNKLQFGNSISTPKNSLQKSNVGFDEYINLTKRNSLRYQFKIVKETPIDEDESDSSKIPYKFRGRISAKPSIMFKRVSTTINALRDFS